MEKLCKLLVSICLDPCCNGITERPTTSRLFGQQWLCLDPCCNGITERLRLVFLLLTLKKS